MKIGVDAVLLGAWAGHTPGSILEVGCGCGVISLLIAQRFPDSLITSIDIDEPSIEESRENFRNAPWSHILQAELETFPEMTLGRGVRYDLIISNPPYFQSGINNPVSPREKARHQGNLSVFSLIETAPSLLKPKGILAMIFPSEFYDTVIEKGREKGLSPRRICFVRDNDKRPEKRVMIEMSMTENHEMSPTHLTLFEGGKPTQDYRNLCKDFYLKF